MAKNNPLSPTSTIYQGLLEGNSRFTKANFPLKPSVIHDFSSYKSSFTDDVPIKASAERQISQL